MPDYFNQKINSAFLMAPPASMTYMTEVFFKIAKIPEMTKIVQWALESLHMYQQGTWNYASSEKHMKICRLFNHKFCDLEIDATMGWNAKDIDVQSDREFDLAFSNIPAG